MSWHTGRLLVELGGRTVLLDDCSWVLVRPCSCLAAAFPASAELASVDGAWKHFYSGARNRKVHREVDYAKRYGFSVELRTATPAEAQLYPPEDACPHGTYRARRAQTVAVGTRYGRLVTLAERAPGQELVKCRCDCGTELEAKWSLLRTGSTSSCGCLRREVTITRSTRHGRSGTSIYMTWADMVGRCTRPTHKRYADYGGRGITVCDRWLDFANFLADMGERPPGLTLDRIDNDRGYEPGNVRWTDYSTQAKNRRPSAYAGSVRDAETGRFLPKGKIA